MSELIKPEEFTIKDSDGKEKTYILSNFDAIEGRRIITQYPLTGIPKVGDYDENEKLMFRLMNYVAVKNNGQVLRLSTPELIKNHVPDPEVLMKIEMKMMEKNFSFFRDGRSLDFFERMTQLFLTKLSETSINSLAQLSPVEKPLSTN